MTNTTTPLTREQKLEQALTRARNAILFAAGRSDHKGTCLSLQQEVAKIDVALASRAAEPAGDVQALSDALSWCVVNSGECLGDHPKRLAAYAALAGAKHD